MQQQIQTTIHDAVRTVREGRLCEESALVTALNAVQQSDASLAPLLAELAFNTSGSVQVFAICALGRLRDGAAAYVPTLKTMLKENHTTLGPVVSSALGSIGTPTAVHALVQALEDRSGLGINYSAAALRMAGTSAVPALPALHKMLESAFCSPFERHWIHTAIEGIRTAAKQDRLADPLQQSLNDYIPLLRYRHLGETAYEHFAGYQATRLSEEAGLVHDERFRFLFTQESEIGLKIYRHSRDEAVVVLSHDDESHGDSLAETSEYIATAVLHVFDLVPRQTSWIEHCCPLFPRLHEAVAVLTFAHDAASGILKHSTRTPQKNLPQSLRRLGIEY